MTTLLKKAIDAANHLNDDEQDSIAQIIIDELEDEQRWNKSFDNSQKKLSLLANEALEEYRSGKSKPHSF